MPWFRVDDSFAFHAKTVAAGNAAIGMWLRAGSWSMQQLTDGFVAAHVIPSLGSKALATALVRAGLWEEVDGGYQFHGWLEYQPSAAEIMQERASKHEAKVKAGRIGGMASGVARRKHARSKPEANGEANPKQNEAPSHPIPVVSSSLRNESSPTLPAQRQPDSATSAWQTTETERDWRDTLRDELEAFYGCNYPQGWVNRTIELVIGSRQIENPIAYVMTAVKADPKRFGPTTQPRNHPLAGITVGRAL